MMFKKKCYLVYGIAPKDLNAKGSNLALNEWIKNKALGKVIYHEHFANKPLGGIAVFEVNTQEELNNLKNEYKEKDSHLNGWNLSCHPLIHTKDTEGFIYQTQYTLSTYRGVNMTYKIDN
mgnify:CR=1 FL=1